MEIIDNSQANDFRTCPLLWYQRNVLNLEPKPKLGEVEPMDLGTRVHELFEEHYQELKGTPIIPYSQSPIDALEFEAQMIFAAYQAKYPVEEFEVVDVERTFKIQLPNLCPECYRPGRYDALLKMGTCDSCGCFWYWNRHVLTGKIDLTLRQNGLLDIMDHKSERRRANSNHPKKWAARDQASLYLWAASKIYPNERIGNFYVNVVKRPSDKFQEGPIFPDRQRLERTQEQIDLAIRNIVVVADEIERYKVMFGDTVWPDNKEACTEGTWGDCDFYLPCTYGWSDEIRELKYQQRRPYLKLGDVPIIQP